MPRPNCLHTTHMAILQGNQKLRLPHPPTTKRFISSHKSSNASLSDIQWVCQLQTWWLHRKNNLPTASLPVDIYKERHKWVEPLTSCFLSQILAGTQRHTNYVNNCARTFICISGFLMSWKLTYKVKLLFCSHKSLSSLLSALNSLSLYIA